MYLDSLSYLLHCAQRLLQPLELQPLWEELLSCLGLCLHLQAAGWLDEAVPAANLQAAAQDAARALAKLDRTAHVATKLRVRKNLLVDLDEAIEADLRDWKTRMAAAL